MDLISPFDLFQEILEKEGIRISKTKFEKINEFILLLLEKNKEVNLTRIVSEEETWIKNILDSLIPSKFLKFEKGMKVMDLGTGGGLPGIPLAILFPSVQFTLVDSTYKKVEIVKEFVKTLALRNVKVISARAEELGHDPEHREQYDMVITRAVAHLRILTELCVPLIHPYGVVVAYKGPDYITELLEARNAITKLKAEPPKVHHYSLPAGMGKRTLVIINKKEPCPDVYPRRSGMPSKRPL